MLRTVKRFFLGPSVAEAHSNGRATVDAHLAEAISKKDEADHLYALASGGFNTKPHHDAFDRGVVERLTELGYSSPYDLHAHTATSH